MRKDQFVVPYIKRGVFFFVIGFEIFVWFELTKYLRKAVGQSETYQFKSVIQLALLAQTTKVFSVGWEL